MPGNLQLFNIAVIALQYSLVILLYYFLYRVVKIAARDMANLVSFPKSEVLTYKDKKQEDNSLHTAVARLVVLEDKQQLLSSTAFTINESLTIGRGQHNTVIIDSGFVSHEHVCISRVKKDYLLTDLNSTNGTIVNGQRIEEETALADGDLIQIGSVLLKFER